MHMLIKYMRAGSKGRGEGGCMHVFDTAILLYKIMRIQANNRLNGVGGKARYIYTCIEPDQR